MKDFCSLRTGFFTGGTIQPAVIVKPSHGYFDPKFIKLPLHIVNRTITIWSNKLYNNISIAISCLKPYFYRLFFQKNLIYNAEFSAIVCG